MLIPYLICLIAGGCILGFSVFAGSDDGDVDGDGVIEADGVSDIDVGGDVDADVGGDVGGDVDSAGVSAGDVATAALAKNERREVAIKRWRPLKEMRFWTFFAAFFGLAGTLFHFFGSFSMVAIEASFSAVLGLGSGLLASYVFHAMTMRQSNSMATVTDYEGLEGKVLLPIAPGAEGKVRLSICGQIHDLPATTMDEGTLDRGENVLVTKYAAGQVRVTKVN